MALASVREFVLAHDGPDVARLALALVRSELCADATGEDAHNIILALVEELHRLSQKWLRAAARAFGREDRATRAAHADALVDLLRITSDVLEAFVVADFAPEASP